MPPKKKPATPTPRRRSGNLPSPVDLHKHADIPTEELRRFGRWAFLEIVDPWDAQNTTRKFISGKKVDGIGPIFRSE